MATKKKAARKKAPPKKKPAAKKKPPVLNLSECKPMPGPHSACELAARVYMEDTPWPDWIADEFKARLEKEMSEYRTFVDRMNAPAKDIETVVRRLFHQLSAIPAIDGLKAVAHFLDEMKARKQANLGIGGQAVKLAHEAEQSAIDQADLLEKILAGNYAIIKPISSFQSGARDTTNQRSADQGEALVSKRSTN